MHVESFLNLSFYSLGREEEEVVCNQSLAVNFIRSQYEGEERESFGS